MKILVKFNKSKYKELILIKRGKQLMMKRMIQNPKKYLQIKMNNEWKNENEEEKETKEIS